MQRQPDPIDRAELARLIARMKADQGAEAPLPLQAIRPDDPIGASLYDHIHASERRDTQLQKLRDDNQRLEADIIRSRAEAERIRLRCQALLEQSQDRDGLVGVVVQRRG